MGKKLNDENLEKVTGGSEVYNRVVPTTYICNACGEVFDSVMKRPICPVCGSELVTKKMVSLEEPKNLK